MMNSLVQLLSLFTLISVCNAQGYPVGDSCTTPDNKPGGCVNIRGCTPLLELLRNQRQQPSAADFLRRSVCGYEGLDPVVCCPQISAPATPAPPTPKPNSAEDGAYSVLPAPGECGFSNVSHNKVVGGIPAAVGAWPWMVVLGYHPSPRSNSKDPRFLCGASLITSKHVLTAAHCVYNRQDLYFARLGEHDLKSDNDGANPIDITIKDRKIHGGYNPSTFVNDIAVLILDKDVNFTPRIHPICLPVAPEVRQRNYVSTKPFIAGWGAKHFNGPSDSILMETQIPVVSQDQCKDAFARFKSAHIDDRVLCAGYKEGGKDACQGDSGGPFMAPGMDGLTFYQIGVVSYGYRCAEPGVPGVYTRVTSFLDWIIDNVK